MSPNYWSEFYKHFDVMEPSPFALWVNERIPPESRIADVGGGNGRDTVFFRSKGHSADVIDPNSLFPDASHQSASNFDYTGYNIIYCRWFLHAVPWEIQREFLKKIPNEAGLFIEARSSKDINPPQDNHFRNPINMREFSNLLYVMDYRVLFIRESLGWSKNETDDPLLIRIIARKPLSIGKTDLDVSEPRGY